MFQGILDAFQFEFMRNALLAGLLVSIACGIIGSYVVVNRVVFISGGIAHSAYGGIGIGYYFGFNPVIGAILFSLISAFSMGFVQRKTRQRTDTIIGVMWAVGMAIGIVFIDKTEGYKVDLMSYLFGSILTVPAGTLWLMFVLDLIILALVIAFYKELLAMSFDETFARIRNVPVDALYYMLLGMIAVTVVMLMRVVGLILVIALLTIPAAISNQWVKNLKTMMVLASFLGMIFTTLGLFLSYWLNLTSGATIILISGSIYLLSALLHHLITSQRSPQTTLA
jgi:zinc transport system permease protein